MADKKLTAEIDAYIRETLNTTLVGFAGIDRFTNAPRGHRPDDILPGARTVITYGVPWPAPLARYAEFFKDSELMPERLEERFYGREHHEVFWSRYETYNPRVAEANTWFTRYGYDWPNFVLQDMAWNLYRRLEESGYLTLPLPASTGGVGTNLQHTVPERWSFSHRHAAVAAGLGELGIQGLFLAPRYGPNVRLCSVITCAELTPSGLFEDTLCLGEECSKCIKACPNDAYSEDTLAYSIGGRDTTHRRFIWEKCHKGIAVYCGECQFHCPVDERLQKLTRQERASKPCEP